MNATITPAILAALGTAFALRSEQQSVLLGLLEGLVMHGGRTFPLLSAADLEKLADSGLIERRGKRFCLRDPGERPKKFTDEICEAYREATGNMYLFSVKDGVACAELARVASHEEILRRWKLGLAATGWRQTGSVAQLLMKWNDLALSTGAPDGTDVREGDVF